MLEQRPTKRSQTLTLVAVQMAVVLSGRGRGWEWGHRVLLETGSRLIRRLIVAQSLNKLYFWDIVAMSAFCFLYFNSTETWSLYHSKLNLLFLCKSWQSIGYIPGLKKEKKKKSQWLDCLDFSLKSWKSISFDEVQRRQFTFLSWQWGCDSLPTDLSTFLLQTNKPEQQHLCFVILVKAYHCAI